MRALPAITCLWPGLSRLWWRGEWAGLALAVVFGAALNLVLVSTFIWPELLPAGWVIVGWLTVAAMSSASDIALAKSVLLVLSGETRSASYCRVRRLMALFTPPRNQ